MRKFFLILIILCFSCSENKVDSTKSIHSFIDNEIKGDVKIEIFKKEKPSIFIDAGHLHKYNEKIPSACLVGQMQFQSSINLISRIQFFNN